MQQQILIILNNLKGGGAERVSVNIANDMIAAGCNVSLLLGTKEGVYLTQVNPAIPVFELGAVNLWQYINKLPAFLKDKGFTHIFTASDYISVATLYSRRRLRLSCKVIITLHYNLPNQLSMLRWPQRRWLTFINRHILTHADVIIAVSGGVAKGFEKIAGIKKAKNLRVIYNPAFDDSIHVKASEAVPEHLFDNPAVQTLITVGRMDAAKNHALLIEAFAIVKKNFPALQLIIIGKGPEEKALQMQAASLGLKSDTHIIGFKENPFAYIARSDLFVLSSKAEGLPTVLIEALALGVNVVSTDCPSGPDEILNNNNYGWLAENENALALAAAIETALTHKKDPALLKQRALMFHRKNVFPQYMDLLQ